MFLRLDYNDTFILMFFNNVNELDETNLKQFVREVYQEQNNNYTISL